MPPLPKPDKPWLKPIPPAVDSDLWAPGFFKIEYRNDSKDTVEGKIYGSVGVCQDGDWWKVVHTTTRRVIVVVRTEEDALRIGQTLWSKACLALRLAIREEVLERMPLWVKPWIKQCWKEECWVDSQPFIREYT